MENANSESPHSASPFVGLPISEGVRVVVLILGWLACISGVLGNVLLIVTLLCQPALRTLYTVFIVNLAVADLIVVAYSMPMWLLDLSLGYQPVLNEYHCKANAFLQYICLITSVFTLVFISFNRYLNICYYSLYNRWFNMTSTVALCVGTWVISSCEALLPLFHVDKSGFAYSIKAHMCTLDATSKPLNMFVLLATFNITVATVLVGFFSFSTLCFWKRSRRKIEQWSSSEGLNLKPRPNLSSSNMTLILSAVLVFIFLLVLCLPLSVATALIGTARVTPDGFALCSFFFLLNNTINWIVYGVLNKNFRDGYRKLVFNRCWSAVLSMKCSSTSGEQMIQVTAVAE